MYTFRPLQNMSGYNMPLIPSLHGHFRIYDQNIMIFPNYTYKIHFSLNFNVLRTIRTYAVNEIQI